MQNTEIGRPSRWMMRAMEWDDARARYPNIWHEGMPRHVLALERLASRLRLGDRVAVYHPASSKHPERSERFVGIARVTGLRCSRRAGHAWIELDTEHRFDPPLDLAERPRRVFMCCDEGWPAADVALYRRVQEAAAAAGWRPPAASEPIASGDAPAARAGGPSAPDEHPEPPGPLPSESEPPAAPAGPPPRIEPAVGSRLFAGADFSGDMRDPRDGTWLAMVELTNGGLKVIRLEPTGRAGLQACLRDPDRTLMQAEAIGLDFPFGLPEPFAETLLGGPFPNDGWWALARRLERLSRPDYLVALHDFREAHGEVKRLTDETARAFSPLHRVQPDLGPMTYHGIRMIAEDRSRYAIRPFETALGRRLLEVYPGGLLRCLGLDQEAEGAKRGAILAALSTIGAWPVEVGAPFRARCLASRDALDAVIAARCAAAAVLSGEADRSAEELAPAQPARVRREGWIYGLT